MKMPTSNQIRPRAGMAFSGRPMGSDFGNHSWLTNQLIASGEGAIDGATWGIADRARAGVGALWDAAHGSAPDEAYARRMAYERARDEYYGQHYGTARMLGELGGALLPIPGAGLAGIAARMVGGTARFAKFGKALAKANQVRARIKQVTPLAKRERAVISGLGAAGGAGGQLYSDSMTGHFSSWSDYAGAMGGGALQAQMALHARPMVAGAGGGAATSALQDVLNGRAVSATHAAEAAGAGALMGKIGDVIGRGRFYFGVSRKSGHEWKREEYSNKEKELMGEQFSKFRTLANFDLTASTAKKRLLLQAGGYTVPDQHTWRQRIIEAKAGIWANLSKAQLRALAELGSRYRVDHLLPQDVGAITGLVAAQGGFRLPAYLLPDQDQDRQTK